jgi:hypothetical protein
LLHSPAAPHQVRELGGAEDVEYFVVLARARA